MSLKSKKLTAVSEQESVDDPEPENRDKDYETSLLKSRLQALDETVAETSEPSHHWSDESVLLITGDTNSGESIFNSAFVSCMTKVCVDMCARL